MSDPRWTSVPSTATPDPALRIIQYDAAKKSVGIAYLLWFFLGSLGVHRFYLGSWGIGLLMLACTLLAFVTLGITGLVPGAILIWDLFTIPGKIHRHNQRLIATLA